MVTWRAKCWLGSASGYQTLEVQSNTYSGAQQQLKRIYGAEQIINLWQMSRPDGMITADMPEGEAMTIALENLFKVLAFLLMLVFKSIVRLYHHLQKREESEVPHIFKLWYCQRFALSLFYANSDLNVSAEMLVDRGEDVDLQLVAD